MKCKCCGNQFTPIPNDKYDTLCEDCTSASHKYEYECPTILEETIEDIVNNTVTYLGEL